MKETDNKGVQSPFRVSWLVPHLAQTDLQNMMMEYFILVHFIKEDLPTHTKILSK